MFDFLAIAMVLASPSTDRLQIEYIEMRSDVIPPDIYAVLLQPCIDSYCGV